MRGYLVAGVGVCDVGACLLAVRDASVVDIVVPVVPEPRRKVGCAVVGSVGGLPTITLEIDHSSIYNLLDAGNINCQ